RYVGHSAAAQLIGDLSRKCAGPAEMSGIFVLFEELEDASTKAAGYAVEAFSELARRGISDVGHVLIPWLDLGGALAQSSGAAAIKYFKDSPLVLSLIEEPARGVVLKQALESAEADANLALEFFRSAPELLSTVP